MRMTVEPADKTRMMKFMCSGPEWAVFECGLELVADIVATSKPIAEGIEKLLNYGERVFGPVRGIRNQ